jgi:hypothetical protein
MKKLIVIAVALVSLTAMRANAAITINMDAIDVLDDLSVLAPQGTVGLMIVDKLGDGIGNGPELAGGSIAVGAFFAGADNEIVGNITIAGSSAQDGYLAFASSFTIPGGVSGASRFAVVWLPYQALDQTTLQAGWYGWYSDAAGTHDAAWVVPSDGSTINYNMTTVSQGGTVPNASGVASHEIIPEPSTVTLVGLGLLGMVGLIRRRRS